MLPTFVVVQSWTPFSNSGWTSMAPTIFFCPRVEWNVDIITGLFVFTDGNIPSHDLIQPQMYNRGRYSISNINQQLTICQQKWVQPGYSNLQNCAGIIIIVVKFAILCFITTISIGSLKADNKHRKEQIALTSRITIIVYRNYLYFTRYVIWEL